MHPVKLFSALKSYSLGIAVSVLVVFSSVLVADDSLSTSSTNLIMETSKGAIQIELYPDKAPKTVSNFLSYVKAGFYDNTIFHRVIKDFMIQGGGLDDALFKKVPLFDPIPNEADKGLKNVRGTLAMARTGDPHSATSQFFINQRDNAFLDFRQKTGRDWGYSVFGKVTAGMEVVDAIASVETHRQAGRSDVPKEPVYLLSIKPVQ